MDQASPPSVMARLELAGPVADVDLVAHLVAEKRPCAVDVHDPGPARRGSRAVGG